MFTFILKTLRAALVAAIGTALVAKFLLKSNANSTTEEIDLVAIFEGKELVSTADPFYGGKILAVFGGVQLDLRKAQPAPTGVRIDAMVMMGGLNLIVPEGWRVKTAGGLKVLAGGFSDNTRTTAADDVPTVIVEGLVALGGIQATTRSPVEATI